MSTIRVACDLDGVLADFNRAFRQRLALVSGKADTVPQDWHPDLWDWPTSLGYTVKQGLDTWNDIRQDETFWATLPAYPDAFKFLNWLWRTVSVSNWSQKTSHEVCFLTDRSGIRAKDQSEMWLLRHGYSGKVPTVNITNGGKGEVLKAFNITHFLDDRPENIESCRQHSPATAACLLVRPWNQDRVYAPEVRQMADLKDFQRLLSSEF